MKRIKPIILCGGSGSRLWPLSRQSLPKQFVPLLGNQSLLEHTLRRVKDFTSGRPIQILTNIEHRFLVKDHAKLADVEVSMIIESSVRNTAPAILSAALLSEDEDLLLFMPADHLIPDKELFIKTIEKGVEAALSGLIVTYGIRPTSAHTGYGYIKCKGKNDSVVDVEKFIEKPSLEEAQDYFNSGNFYWNAGIFLASASTIISGMEKHAKDIFDSVNLSVKRSKKLNDLIFLNKESFDSTRAESIDFALLENFEKIGMIPFLGEWSDIGGWNAIAELDNTPSENAYKYYSVNTYIKTSNRPVVSLGLNDTIIVDTSDAVLVAHKDYTQKIKEVVGDLSQKGIKQSIEHRHANRPWGSFDSLEEGSGYKVKNLTIESGKSLSLQKHQHRSEHWVVVQGIAKVTCGNRKFILQQNESTFIPKGEIHQLSNPGETTLKIIEIQTGDYLGEDDILRLEDPHGRTLENLDTL